MIEDRTDRYAAESTKDWRQGLNQTAFAISTSVALLSISIGSREQALRELHRMNLSWVDW